jgi:hypothetical protein
VSVIVTITSNRLPPMPANLNRAAKDITRKAILDVVAHADPLTPVETGAMKNNKVITDTSIHWLQDYTGFQNFGTVHVPPRLFATTAVSVVRPQWIAALGQIEGYL